MTDVIVVQENLEALRNKQLPPAPLPGRLLGLDVGSKFIGCAVTDSAQVLTTPLPTLLRKAGSLRLSALERYVKKYQPVTLIVGCPLQTQLSQRSREEQANWKRAALLSPQAKKIKAYAARLRKRFYPLAIEIVDETLSTWESRKRYAHLKLKKTIDAVSLDSFSAMEIIKSYLAKKVS